MEPHNIAIAVKAHHKDEGGNKKDKALSCGLPEEHLQTDNQQLFKILEERHFLTRKKRFLTEFESKITSRKKLLDLIIGPEGDLHIFT